MTTMRQRRRARRRPESISWSPEYRMSLRMLEALRSIRKVFREMYRKRTGARRRVERTASIGGFAEDFLSEFPTQNPVTDSISKESRC